MEYVYFDIDEYILFFTACQTIDDIGQHKKALVNEASFIISLIITDSFTSSQIH